MTPSFCWPPPLSTGSATGLESIITSSSDDRLGRAEALGGHPYDQLSEPPPEWQDEVLRLTDGEGVDLVLEVGGQGTLSRSVASTALGGTIALIGGVSGFGAGPDFHPMALTISAKRMQGVYAGSREMLEDLASFAGLTGLQPVVDATFDFLSAPDAYRRLESGSHFGKLVITVGTA